MAPNVRLHVNIDHVATVRQARRGVSPDPIAWALLAEEAGAQGITCHLRKDRRHIQDADVKLLRERIRTLLNLECSLDPEMLPIAAASRADQICVVPENRQEITTEGGLNVIAESARLREAIPRLAEAGAQISLFIDPEADQIQAAAETGALFVELHTGAYAGAQGDAAGIELQRLVDGAQLAHSLGLRVNAGHGLDYFNTPPVAQLPHLRELNIGHAIVSHALTVGVHGAIQQMLDLIRGGAQSSSHPEGTQQA